MYCNDIEHFFAYIPLVAVDRDFRGHHLSRALLHSAISFAKDNGFNTIGVHTENDVALSIYVSMGFKIIEHSHRKYLELTL